MVYNGQWFTPLRKALDAFADSLEKTVTGDVKLKLYKGNIIQRRCHLSVHPVRRQTASFGEDDDYNQADSGRLHQPVRPVHQGACKAVQELAGGQVSRDIFPSRVFSHFHTKYNRHGAGGTARRSVLPCGGFAVFIKRLSFMAGQLWKGRFSKAVDSRVNDFNSSIRFDQRMIAQDMRGSGVHAAMLAKQGIISEQDCEDILNGLASIAG